MSRDPAYCKDGKCNKCFQCSERKVGDAERLKKRMSKKLKPCPFCGSDNLKKCSSLIMCIFEIKIQIAEIKRLYHEEPSSQDVKEKE